MSLALPKIGFVFWPVGTGDSTTVVIKEKEVVMQIDLHHMEKSDDKEDPHVPIVDELVRLLPRKDNRPYLSVFVLTHPDKDHIQGFEMLLKEINIGEIWHTPRIFNEYSADLSDDAKAFKKEVDRRRKITIKNKGKVGAGDRVRIIGHDEIFEEEDYKDFPQEWRTYPGNSIKRVDGEDCSNAFETFVHAPFKESSEAERNETSLALQVALFKDKHSAKAFLFGDHCYPTIRKIYDKTKEKKRERYLEWDILLAPHHCSKRVMYWQDEGKEKEEFKKDIMDEFENSERSAAYIVASCEADFSDEEGKNPPHLKARKRYEEIIESGHFLSTQEHPDKKKPVAIKFELTEDGLNYDRPKGDDSSKAKDISSAVAAARGGETPPKQQVGFGN